MNILVTGGSGFIGSHLWRRLLDLGHDLLTVDNFCSSTRHNVHDLLAEPRFELMRHDVTFPLYVEVDQIYHLACLASPGHYQRDPVQTTKTCVLGSINMLGLAKRTSAPILLSSTSEVYGDPAMHPQDERYWGNVNPIGTRSCYDEGKRCAETLFFDYRRQHGLAIKVARIFNTYGPRMQPDDGRVISNFIVQALRGEPLTVYGDGSQTRSFCHVDDLVDGLIALMNSSREITGPVNLGNPGRVHDIGTGQKGAGLHRQRQPRRAPPASRRRPGTAPPRHRARPRPARLGTDHAPGRRAGAHRRVLPGRRHTLTPGPPSPCPGQNRLMVSEIFDPDRWRAVEGDPGISPLAEPPGLLFQGLRADGAAAGVGRLS
jgi:UDP-glucuronate decarboxylase